MLSYRQGVIVPRGVSKVSRWVCRLPGQDLKYWGERKRTLDLGKLKGSSPSKERKKKVTTTCHKKETMLSPRMKGYSSRVAGPWSSERESNGKKTYQPS